MHEWTRIASLVAVAGLIACNPYDPELGENPFRCGTAQPRCPDGYSPVDTEGATICECVKGQSFSPTIDAGEATSIDAAVRELSCNDDSRVTGDPGGNESTAEAAPAVIDVTRSWVERKLAICPASDVDVFAIDLGEQAVTIKGKIQFDPLYGLLALNILSPGGDSVASGLLTGNQVLATHTTQSAGTYFVRVKAAAAGNKNNYLIEVVLDD